MRLAISIFYKDVTFNIIALSFLVGRLVLGFSWCARQEPELIAKYGRLFFVNHCRIIRRRETVG